MLLLGLGVRFGVNPDSGKHSCEPFSWILGKKVDEVQEECPSVRQVV